MSLFTGPVIIFAIAYAAIGWDRATSTRQLLPIGCLWVALTVALEVTPGRLVLGYPWGRITSDYDVARGGPMPLGLALLAAVPLAAAKLRRRRTRRATIT